MSIRHCTKVRFFFVVVVLFFSNLFFKLKYAPEIFCLWKYPLHRMKAGHEQAYKTAIGVKKLCGAGRGEGNVCHQTLLTRSISHSFHFNKPLCHGRKTFPHEIHTGCSQHAPNTDLASRKPLYSLQDFDKAFYLRNFTRADVPKEKNKKQCYCCSLLLQSKTFGVPPPCGKQPPRSGWAGEAFRGPPQGTLREPAGSR